MMAIGQATRGYAIAFPVNMSGGSREISSRKSDPTLVNAILFSADRDVHFIIFFLPSLC